MSGSASLTMFCILVLLTLQFSSSVSIPEGLFDRLASALDVKCWVLFGRREEIERTVSTLSGDILQKSHLRAISVDEMDVNAAPEALNEDKFPCNVLVHDPKTLLPHIRNFTLSRLFETFDWYLPYDDEVINVLHLRLDTRVFLFKDSDNLTTTCISEVYRVKNGTVKENLVGSWSEGGKIWLTREYIWQRRKNLTGVLISNVVEHSLPALIIDFAEGSNVIRGISGIFPDVFFLLQSVMNFSLSLQVSKDRIFGVKAGDGRWTGMVGMLERREVDMSMAGFSITDARSEVMDFSLPLYQDLCKLFIRRPSAALNWFTFIDVFNYSFWLAVLLFYIVFASYLLLVNKYATANSFHAKEDSEQFGILNAIGFVGIAFMQQEYMVETKSPTVKILKLTTFATTFMIFTAYCAVLTSSLTLEVFEPPVNGLQDVYDKHFRLLVWRGTIYENFFLTATAGSLEETLWNERIKKDPLSFVTSRLEGFTRVLADRDASDAFFGPSLTSSGVLNVNLKNVSCDIIELPTIYLKMRDAMGFQKGSEFTQLFSYHMNKMHEGWSSDKILRLYLPERSEACPTEAEAIGFENTAMVFVMLASGLVVAAMLSVVERITKNSKKNTSIGKAKRLY